MGFARREYWSVQAFLSPGIFPIQGWNLGILHCRQIFYPEPHRHKSPGATLTSWIIYLAVQCLIIQREHTQCAMNYWKELLAGLLLLIQAFTLGHGYSSCFYQSVYTSQCFDIVCASMPKARSPLVQDVFHIHPKRLRLVLTVSCVSWVSSGP